MADLTPQQIRAADLLGRNWPQADVAFETQVSERTVSRWLNEIPTFAALVKERRNATLAQVPNATATLEAALSATKDDGKPDWAIRVKAAQLLMTTADPGGAPDPVADRPTRVYVTPDE